MGTLIAFIYPASMSLHVVHEKTTTRLVAKVCILLPTVFFLVMYVYTATTTTLTHNYSSCTIVKLHIAFSVVI